MKTQAAGPEGGRRYVTFGGMCVTPTLEVWPEWRKYRTAPLCSRVTAWPRVCGGRRDPRQDEIAAELRQTGVTDRAVALAAAAAAARQAGGRHRACHTLVQRAAEYPALFIKANLPRYILDPTLNPRPRVHRSVLCALAVGWMAFYALLGKGLAPYRRLPSAVSLHRAAAAFARRADAVAYAQYTRDHLCWEGFATCHGYLGRVARLAVAREALVALSVHHPLYEPALAFSTAADAAYAAAPACGCVGCCYAEKRSSYMPLLRGGLANWVQHPDGVRDTSTLVYRNCFTGAC
eukprot:TRINITY_DN4696_c0_g1_i2.p1 TRINITY_DN4696_c0_g1~~TRINITY_DN4696_c0_g1_i2.p1  ORF type:complete len:292 (+),score=52.41 TRINITY_DN4696_c0_g1_i2:276-1151(+)